MKTTTSRPRLFVSAAPVVSVLAACLAGSQAAARAQDAVPVPVAGAALKPAVSIEWQPRTLTLVHGGGGFGRMVRLRSGELLCSFGAAGKVWVRRSVDNGASWQEPVQVAAWPYGGLANASLLQLSDGLLLCFYNERPRRARPKAGEPVVANTHPFAISMARSADGGRTWQAPATLYQAGTEPSNGCWEPSAVQLPSGEVQLFFANEGPYRASDEQEITLLRSQDGARTWSAPQAASFRKGSRDGMPVPLVLRDARGAATGIAVAIEDNGLSGTFKPVIVWASLDENWRSGAVGAASPNRWGALEKPLPAVAYAGAPFLRQLPGGETILAFQEDDRGDIEHARILVGVGDAQARGFAGLAFPFPPTPGKNQLWPSLFVKDAHTITALCETTINGAFGLWSIDGHLVREAAANR